MILYKILLISGAMVIALCSLRASIRAAFTYLDNCERNPIIFISEGERERRRITRSLAMVEAICFFISAVWWAVFITQFVYFNF